MRMRKTLPHREGSELQYLRHKYTEQQLVVPNRKARRAATKTKQRKSAWTERKS